MDDNQNQINQMDKTIDQTAKQIEELSKMLDDLKKTKADVQTTQPVTTPQQQTNIPPKEISDKPFIEKFLSSDFVVDDITKTLDSVGHISNEKHDFYYEAASDIYKKGKLNRSEFDEMLIQVINTYQTNKPANASVTEQENQTTTVEKNNESIPNVVTQQQEPVAQNTTQTLSQPIASDVKPAPVEKPMPPPLLVPTKKQEPQTPTKVTNETPTEDKNEQITEQPTQPKHEIVEPITEQPKEINPTPQPIDKQPSEIKNGLLKYSKEAGKRQLHHSNDEFNKVAIFIYEIFDEINADINQPDNKKKLSVLNVILTKLEELDKRIQKEGGTMAAWTDLDEYVFGMEKIYNTELSQPSLI